jgi:hypothetical protein
MNGLLKNNVAFGLDIRQGLSDLLASGVAAFRLPRICKLLGCDFHQTSQYLEVAFQRATGATVGVLDEDDWKFQSPWQQGSRHVPFLFGKESNQRKMCFDSSLRHFLSLRGNKPIQNRYKTLQNYSDSAVCCPQSSIPNIAPATPTGTTTTTCENM